jgi:polysaccharide export outer membrane protein
MSFADHSLAKTALRTMAAHGFGLMPIAGRALTVGLLCFALCFGLFAQDAQHQDFVFKQKGHAPSPADVLREFDAPVESDYRIAEGDEIQIDVWNRPELSNKYIVGPDGKITLPYAGVLKVADLTRGEAEQAALKLWQDSYENLKVTVSVLHYEGIRIFVLGRVAQPGVLHFDTQPTLLEAVARSGAMPVSGSATEKSGLTRCVVFRGNDKVVWVDLRSLLNGSNLALNIHLRRDDTLFLPDSDDQLVYVMGEVLRPGAVRLTPDMTFMDALEMAGGPTKDAASSIHLVRHAAKVERDISIDQIVHKGPSADVVVENGDIIYVPRRGLAKVGYLLQQLSPAVSYFVLANGL